MIIDIFKKKFSKKISNIITHSNKNNFITTDCLYCSNTILVDVNNINNISNVNKHLVLKTLCCKNCKTNIKHVNENDIKKAYFKITNLILSNNNENTIP